MTRWLVAARQKILTLCWLGQNLGTLRQGLTHSPLVFSSHADIVASTSFDAEPTIKARRLNAKALWRLGADKTADRLRIDRLHQYRSDIRKIQVPSRPVRSADVK